MGRSLGGTLYKLLGILAIMQAMRMLPDVLLYATLESPGAAPYDPDVVALAYLVPFPLFLGGGLFLVLRGDRLAAKHARPDEGAAKAASEASIHASLLSVAGVFLIGFALAQLVEPVAKLIVETSRDYDLDPLRPNLVAGWAGLAGGVVQLGLGVVLVLKNTALVTLFRRRWDRTRAVAADDRCPHCGFWIVTSDYRPGAPAYRCDNCRQEIPRDVVEAARPSTGQAG